MDEKKLLKKRAAHLASGIVFRDDEGTMKEFLEFGLSGEHYAIESSFVSEAMTVQDLTPIPGTHGYLLGLMNVRGRIIPVVNLKKFFRLKEEGIEASAKAIIMQSQTYEVAFLADTVLSTSRITEPKIKPVPSNINGIASEHLLGVTGEALIIIDGASLINRLESSLTNRNIK